MSRKCLLKWVPEPVFFSRHCISLRCTAILTHISETVSARKNGMKPEQQPLPFIKLYTSCDLKQKPYMQGWKLETPRNRSSLLSHPALYSRLMPKGVMRKTFTTAASAIRTGCSLSISSPLLKAGLRQRLFHRGLLRRRQCFNHLIPATTSSYQKMCMPVTGKW